MRPFHICLAFWTILLFRAVSPVFAESPVIGSVRIEGGKDLSVRDLQNSLETRPGAVLDSLVLHRDVERILDHCRKAGRYLAEVDFPVVTQVNSRCGVVFPLREGLRIRVRRIHLAASVSPDVLDGFQTKAGEVFRPDRFEADIENILRRYENSGYPFCAVYPTIGVPDSNGEVDLSLRTELGPSVQVGGLKVSGARSTRSDVLWRMTGLKVGDPYDQSRVDRGRSRLIRSGLFDRVGDVKLMHEPEKGAVHLSLEVEEGRANQIDGVVGYVPGTEGGRGYVAGQLDLAFRNLAGTGRRASIRWDRKGPSASDLAFHYDEPWIGSTPLAGRFRFELLQRLGYVSAGIGFGVRIPLTGAFGLEVETGWDQVSPDSSGLGHVPRSRTWRSTMGLSYETRDHPNNPRNGSFIKAVGSFGRASFPATNRRVNRWRIEGDAERFFPILKGQTIAVMAHFRGIHTGEAVAPLSEKLRLGGASSLRGYREEQFAGVRALWGGVEHRFLIGRRSRVFLFLDSGLISDRLAFGPEVREMTLYRTGYGAGLRTDSRAGVVGVDVGFGQDEGLGGGKIHIRMIHLF